MHDEYVDFSRNHAQIGPIFGLIKILTAGPANWKGMLSKQNIEA